MRVAWGRIGRAPGSVNVLRLPLLRLPFSLLRTLRARGLLRLRRVGFDVLPGWRFSLGRLERLPQVRQDLLSGRRHSRENAIGRGDELESLADGARAHGAATQLVLEPF